MRFPWFTHMQNGSASQVSLFPTPVGTFVITSDRMEVVWYPMDPSFPGGASRVVKGLPVDGDIKAPMEQMRAMEDAVLDFIHAHPTMALIHRYDTPAGAPIDWSVMGSGALATHENRHGLFFKIHHGGTVTLEFLPNGGNASRSTLGVFADTCDEDTLRKRIDARVARQVAQLDKTSRDSGKDTQ